MEKNKKIQQDKKVAYDLKVAEASGQFIVVYRHVYNINRSLGELRFP